MVYCWTKFFQNYLPIVIYYFLLFFLSLYCIILILFLHDTWQQEKQQMLKTKEKQVVRKCWHAQSKIVVVVKIVSEIHFNKTCTLAKIKVQNKTENPRNRKTTFMNISLENWLAEIAPSDSAAICRIETINGLVYYYHKICPCKTMHEKNNKNKKGKKKEKSNVVLPWKFSTILCIDWDSHFWFWVRLQYANLKLNLP